MTVRLAVMITVALVASSAGGAPGNPATTPPAPKVPAAGAATKRRPPPTPFRAIVDMATFMDHVLTPAATIVWRTNGFVIDATGEHDLAPKTDADWELVVSGAATLAEATNALRIPQRTVDGEWNAYVDKLADAAARAYEAAEHHDLKTLADVSDHLDEICSSCHRRYGAE